MEFDDLKRPGGTSGGIIEFLLGLAMAIAGAFMLINRVVVASGFWNWGGYNSFGLSLIPLAFGIGFVFFIRGDILKVYLVFRLGCFSGLRTDHETAVCQL